jgi:para-nitrobenzyl esterase
MKLATLFFSICIFSVSGKVVQIANGKLKGTQTKSEFAFYRIPYAKPPVGKLRFQAPRPVDNWRGILDATKPGPRCFQPVDNYERSEDCLHLNVFTRNLTGSQPVVVRIHGGAFQIGYSASDSEFSFRSEKILI